MVHRWFGKTKFTISIPLMLVLLLAIACGTSAPPAATPTSPPATTAAPTEPANTPGAAEATAVPTAMPQATRPPGDAATANPEVAPPFAEYWNPPVEFYGEPVKGGTLRVIYEDPLEHANSWGASTGSATRFRSATMNNIVSVDPYDNTKIIPDLAKGWTQEGDGTGITFFFHDGIKWHNGADFTCEDARFTLQTWITGEGITASSMKGILSFIDLDKTECVDDLTLKVGFKQPTAYSLLAFSWSVGFIFNKAWFGSWRRGGHVQ
jgi:ABC-type transport system substrate-binding protein